MRGKEREGPRAVDHPLHDDLAVLRRFDGEEVEDGRRPPGPREPAEHARDEPRRPFRPAPMPRRDDQPDADQLDERDEDDRHAEDQVEDLRVDMGHELREDRDRGADRQEIAPDAAQASIAGPRPVRKVCTTFETTIGRMIAATATAGLHDRGEARDHDERHGEADRALHEAREERDGDGDTEISIGRSGNCSSRVPAF
jgi:hypothetical protein